MLGQKHCILNPNRWFEDRITRNTHCRHQGRYLSAYSRESLTCATCWFFCLENISCHISDSQIIWHEIFSKQKNQQVAHLTYKEQIQKCKLKAAELQNVGAGKELGALLTQPLHFSLVPWANFFTWPNHVRNLFTYRNHPQVPMYSEI